MSTTTLQSKNPAAYAPGVGQAFRQLISALIAPLQSRDLAHEARSAAQEAAEVREMAYAYASSDPGFADDLYAAADRHEVANGRYAPQIH